MRAVIFATGAVVAGLYLCVVAAAARGNYGAWLFALPVYLITSGLVAVALHWPAVQHEREIHITEIERLRTDAYHLQQARKPAAEREPVTVDAEAERQYRWHRFWSDCLEYASENGFHFRNNFDRVLRYEGWYNGFAIPMVKAGWLRPIAQAIRTEPMPEWTATKMLRELAAGSPPPYPIGEPPEWKQTASQNTGKHSENTQTVFATDH
jgi:hypothetical protein